VNATECDENVEHGASPHSAAADSTGEGPSGTKAGARAGAREDSTSTAELPPQSAVAPRDRFLGWVDQLKDVITPPDIVNNDRPSLRKKWAYATEGGWTTEAGALRNAGKVYSVTVAMAGAVAGYSLEWVTERPSRFAGALLLLFCLFHIPPLSWLT
jgi:hypothetical protein